MARTQLCTRCRSLDFRALTPEEKGRSFDLTYVLHSDKASFVQSLDAKCQFCHLVRGQLGQLEVPSPVCDQLNAFVVLRLRMAKEVYNVPTASTTNPRVMFIASRLGNGCLRAIPDLPGE
jgi:hypothetical protein